MLGLEILMVALSAIRANLMRSALTTLGIVIGVSAVISVVALGEGAQRQVEAQIERMGTNVLTIHAGQRFFGGVSTGDSEDLTVRDAEALRDKPGGVLTISPEVSSRSQLAYLRWNSSNDVRGVWPEYFGIYNHALEFGRFFSQGEVRGRRRVVVLGNAIPEELGTPAANLVGKTIQIGGQPFEVIGILAEKGETSFYFRPDEWAFIPTSTAQFRLFGGRGQRLSSIYAQVPSAEFMDQAFADIDQVLRREHRIRPGKDVDFSIRNSSDLVATFNETTQTFTLLLAGIAGISLLVGGIGIMNIMLVSVTERTREIGVRKALGATRRAILLQFLIEALVLCGLGGLLGVIAGFAGARLMTQMANWQTVVAPSAVVIALGFSVGIGLLFGIWPARRAARMDPIDALRYE
ncbi:MAG: ABC transporter permease [Gemmatimonadota bacterium]|nr:MAG: ABC transporter permease [Gemmatimonadota bacterium]